MKIAIAGTDYAGLSNAFFQPMGVLIYSLFVIPANSRMQSNQETGPRPALGCQINKRFPVLAIKDYIP